LNTEGERNALCPSEYRCRMIVDLVVAVGDIAPCVPHEANGLAQFSWIRPACCFGNRENGCPHGLEIAAHAGAIVREGRGDAADVSGRRIAGHQALDHLPREERAGVRMVEQAVERDTQRLGAWRIRGNGRAEKCHRQVRVVCRVEPHRVRCEASVGHVVIVPGHIGEGAAIRQIVPVVAREHPREIRDVALAVGFDGLVVGVESRRAILIEFE
jgi:hypothetical protein